MRRSSWCTACAKWKELAYHDYLSKELPAHEFLGEMVSAQMLYYPTVTREAFEHQGRITTLIESDQLTRDLGLPAMTRRATAS
jgi:ferredoxin--NADP+ reductase